jgi:DNA-binding NarL/FixJ family response regulator
MKPIRVLLADDHPLMRAGIRSQLHELPEVEVIAEACDGHEAIALVRRDRPDVVLLDIAMPRLNGLEAAAQINREFPEVGIVILTMHAGEEYVRRALRAGARGYVLKDAESVQLRLAVSAAARGEVYLSPAVAEQLVGQYKTGQAAPEDSWEKLTPRQREVLQQVAEGCSTKEIARKLRISPRTVETHRSQLMQHLDIHDVAGLVRYALRMGLVNPES